MKTVIEQATQVAIAVVQHDGQFLIGVRPDGKPLAGFAEFPGGKVDAGEIPAQAAIRECFEESALCVEVIEKYFSTVHRYSHGLLEIHFFHCQPVALNQSEDDSLPTPKPPFRWVFAAELASLEFPAANRKLTQFLLRKAGINLPMPTE